MHTQILYVMICSPSPGNSCGNSCGWASHSIWPSQVSGGNPHMLTLLCCSPGVIAGSGEGRTWAGSVILRTRESHKASAGPQCVALTVFCFIYVHHSVVFHYCNATLVTVALTKSKGLFSSQFGRFRSKVGWPD